MNDEYLDMLAWQQAYNERLNRYRRGAQFGSRPQDCTCPGVWMSILPPPACPYHGQADSLTITC